jgi:hypothetical protein
VVFVEIFYVHIMSKTEMFEIQIQIRPFSGSINIDHLKATPQSHSLYVYAKFKLKSNSSQVLRKP